jgi:hypothetical protein
MKAFIALVGLLTLVAFSGALMAADKPADKPKKASVKGEVVKVEGTKVTIKSKKADVVVDTNDKTEVIIEGKAGKVADLKAGQKVVATVTDGVATRIEVAKPKAAKPAAK